MSKRLTQPLNYLLFDSEDTVFKENQILTFVQQYPDIFPPGSNNYYLYDHFNSTTIFFQGSKMGK